MDTVRSWREIVPLNDVALAVLVVLFVWVFPLSILNGHVGGGCVIAPSGQEGAGWAFCDRQVDPGTGDLQGIMGLILGASVLVALAYAARLSARFGRSRPELLAFLGWTIGFWHSASTPNYALSDRVCIAGLNPGFIEEEPLGQCFLPWVPGWDRMALWLLVSLAILGMGYLLRHQGSRVEVHPATG